MAIEDGFTVRTNDYINEAERDATPANDEGKVVKLEDDGKLHPFFIRNGDMLIAGETLNGSTLPVPVYQDASDARLYASKSDDTDKMKFTGFVTSNSTAGNPIRYQASGLVGGFSGLTVGAEYFVQTTAGTIGTTRTQVRAGIAISATTLLIMHGQRQKRGEFSRQASVGTTPVVVTLGFRPKRIRVFAVWGNFSATSSRGYSNGGWTEIDGNRCIMGTNATNVNAGFFAWAYYIATHPTSSFWRGNVQNVSDTGFEITVQASSHSSADRLFVYWEAEGDI